MSEPILKFEGLTRRFGGIVAVNDVTLALERGEIVGLIGPNGADKTTPVNLVTGFIQKTSGHVLFNDQDTTRLPPHRIVQQGIARTFKILQFFSEMTVLENVMAGALFASGKTNMRAAAHKARHFLEFTGLASHAEYQASDLSLAYCKRLEFAKSLAMDFRLLLLDEVNASPNTSEPESALDLIRAIEYLMKIILLVVERIIVLHHVAKLNDGTPSEVMNDPAVIEAHIGHNFAQRFRAQTRTKAMVPTASTNG